MPARPSSPCPWTAEDRGRRRERCDAYPDRDDRGHGNGDRHVDPAGIDCGSDCSEPYAEGRNDARSDTGSVLVVRRVVGRLQRHWRCCQVTMNATASVTATFTSSGGATTIFPSSFTVRGVTTGGTVASLAADDDSFLVVTSSNTTSGLQRGTGFSPAWTTRSVPSPRRSEGKASATCTQTISTWRWTDSTWVDLDSRRWGRPNRGRGPQPDRYARRLRERRHARRAGACELFQRRAYPVHPVRDLPEDRGLATRPGLAEDRGLATRWPFGPAGPIGRRATRERGVGPRGLEPRTCGLRVRCSARLS